ncbi:hypothetical protein [Streptomyces sp. NPDC056669]
MTLSALVLTHNALPPAVSDEPRDNDEFANGTSMTPANWAPS